MGQRAVAVVYGSICHLSFFVAVASMVYGLYTGMTSGLGRMTGIAAWVANGLLLLQFPLLHSALLTGPGSKLVSRLAPARLGGDLSTTIYATIASWQLLSVFVLWSPSGVIWAEATGPVWVVSCALYAGAWVFLAKTMSDAGMAVQTGSLGWTAVARCRQPAYAAFQPRGTFRHVRQPVYVAFSLTLWTAPVWTPDRLVLACLWTAYCLIGPLFKEERYRRRYGGPFQSYQLRVPYWLPQLGKGRAHHSLQPINEGRGSR